jgi:elongation of very long chain fatty acids protein 6
MIKIRATYHNIILFFRVICTSPNSPKQNSPRFIVHHSELIDTLFIVVHKKKLIFLHWYHHVTVLLYCWHSYVTSSPTGVFFCGMNYGVHSIMYFYYFLMAIKIKPPWAMLITTLQISQMIVGVILTALGFIYVGSSPNCWISAENNRAAFCMYGSYLALFLQFFVARYFGGKKGSKSKKE